jgi:hypothetical protein
VAAVTFDLWVALFWLAPAAYAVAFGVWALYALRCGERWWTVLATMWAGAGGTVAALLFVGGTTELEATNAAAWLTSLLLARCAARLDQQQPVGSHRR